MAGECAGFPRSSCYLAVALTALPASGRCAPRVSPRLIEYEPSTLAPLGLVVGADELNGRRVVVVGSGTEECDVSRVVGMEGADCVDSEPEEQAVLLVDDATGASSVGLRSLGDLRVGFAAYIGPAAYIGLAVEGPR